MTKRQSLSESSHEVLAHKIKGQKLEAGRQAANEDYRCLQAAPIEDHDARIAKIANGEAVEQYIDRESRIRAAANRCRDFEEACKLHHKQGQPITYKALGELAKTFLSEERAILKRMGAALVEALAASAEHQELRDYFIGQGGLVGICLSHPETVLGHPRDRNSDLAILLREFVAMGVLDKMPASLK